MAELKELVARIEALKVLYVEDEPDVNRQVMFFLQKFFTHVDNAFDGKEGLERFGANEYDVIISDIQMPGMSGLEMIGRMKEHKPDLFYCTLSANEISGQTLCNLQLQKPLTFDEMIRLVEAVAQWRE